MAVLVCTRPAFFGIGDALYAMHARFVFHGIMCAGPEISNEAYLSLPRGSW